MKDKFRDVWLLDVAIDELTLKKLKMQSTAKAIGLENYRDIYTDVVDMLKEMQKELMIKGVYNCAADCEHDL